MHFHLRISKDILPDINTNNRYLHLKNLHNKFNSDELSLFLSYLFKYKIYNNFNNTVVYYYLEIN